MIKQLNLPVIKHSLPISAIDATTTESRGLVQITIQSKRGEFRKELTCLTIPIISKAIPAEIFPRDSIAIPANIKLADPDFHLPHAIDLLIGSGATLSLFSIGQINLTHEGYDLYLQKTRLGWVVAGSTPPTDTLRNTCYLSNLESQLIKFWEIEEVPIEKSKSGEELECEAHFINTTTRDSNGRYTVKLPFRQTNKQIGDSRDIALKRLLAVERRFESNTALKFEYSKVLQEYIDLKHMSLIENPDDNGYYLPHHAVIKDSSDTTRIRVVFDASAKSNNGVSLNDVLMIGPTIQPKLFSHLLRFRTYKYIIIADIEKMYRQIQLHEEDRRYQRILWRINGKIETFQLNTLTFGVSSSPFLAIRVIQQLANDECQTYPKAAKIISNHLYVDDLLSGADTIAETREIRDELIALLKRGGFTIRKWASNDERVINDLEPNALHTHFILHADQSLKALGLAWSARGDKIYYSAYPIQSIERWTKRNILSEIAKIFDPIGLLGPIILHVKGLMQDIWRCGLQWDESVPQSIHTEWSEFVRQMGTMNQISFDRKVLIDGYQDVQLHGFCDASNRGYGACLYVRSRGNVGEILVRLLCAKSRVAPVKTITIPRLELCGTLLLAQLYHETSSTLKNIPNRTVWWCDSTVALHWIKTQPHFLKTFVANRVTEIQRLTNSNDWRHVPSEDNPADALSRGQLPHAFLRNSMWVNGPSWLSKDENDWPNKLIPIIETPELKQNTCLITTINDFDILNRCSSYSKLIGIIAYCLRFRLDNKRVGQINADEIKEAEIRILRIGQATQFADVIKDLKNKNTTKQGKIANLIPFIDDDGLIRVGGRLQKSDLAFSQKHPILLPSRHPLTDNIIREIHQKHFHAGIQTTLCLIRQRFWLLDGRNQVRKIVRTCTRCFRFNAIPIEYKMGNLPQARIRETTPFTHTGVDFCGPFYIKEKKYRNRNRVKVYVCVFVCMSVKAIHLEVVSDLTSDGFIAALRRFIARRGIPEHIYSDNGTNFVGANNQLKELYALFQSDEHKNTVNKFANGRRIRWHFIPPVAPHYGGLWEASVKIFKHHAKRVLGDSLFTFEELNTFVIEVEGILNSRPIASISSDPNDLLVLTPAHCLIGRPITTLPEGELLSVPANRLSTWKHISKVRQDFWTRWSLEYLNELQTRTKWIKNGPELKVGAVVLIKDKNQPCTQWNMGRISELHSGEDGVARAATVKTASGEIKRATNYLCLLPIEQ
mgnify:CR=1 FL=1